MKEKKVLHSTVLTVFTLLVLTFVTAQAAVNFPEDFSGTWKRDKYDNTLTFSSNTVNASNQDNIWEIQSVSRDTYKIKSANTTRTITVKINKDSLVISGDKGSGENNWNGTWKKQAVTTAVQNFTGNGGKGTSIAILAPKATGLAENQSYLPALVQGEFVSNFSGFSAISVLDRERLDDQYTELLSGYYDDKAQAGLDLGKLTPTTHIMGGNITRTATGYALQMQITRTADKMTTASYSGTFTFADLDNLTGIRRASLELLQKMGVTLTAQAQGELTGAAMDNHVSAQTALARGITAQQRGTEVAALSYYFQAAAFDPSLTEAINRSSILNANISSGNIGNDVRSDIQWRRDWVARLTETEQYFDSFNRNESMPYTLFYLSDEIKQGTINYQNETVTLSVETHLHGSGIWTLSLERALQAVYDGLEATKRKDTWGLGSWPRQGVTNLNAFARRNGNFSVVFELLNSQNKVIGRQTLQSSGYWELNWSGRPVINVYADERKTLNFQNVNANDITDSMTIRVATINGIEAETAARNRILQIRAVKKNIFVWYDQYRFTRGEIQSFMPTEDERQKLNQGGTLQLTIPGTIWGDPIISIGRGAFENKRLTNISIPNSVTYIGERAFANNFLTVLFIPNVTYIGDSAFSSNPRIGRIIIGANVEIARNAIVWINETQSYIFKNDYDRQGRIAGFYSTKTSFGEGIVSLLTLGFADSPNYWRLQKSAEFPAGFIGTWKRINFDNTLTLTANTLKSSSQSSTRNLLDIASNSYYFADNNGIFVITIKLVKGNLEISDDSGNGQDNWNGTWRKQ